uniref:Ribosomal protein S3 n=1 Tax=Hirsutella vermicola TaxID=369263 RepID=A0A1S6KM19_9HYPO|nr:ribosomal protein S3 [Hirsutella vermicola]AQT19609.1 ribosomal protein S3 [Hirsutella vermicola]
MKIFNNNLKNPSKIIGLKRKKDRLGKIKYFPSFSKEWKNIIYCYNQNNLKNIPVNNVNINKIIKSYFNLYFKNRIFVSHDTKFILLKRRKDFLKRIFVSNAEIKHTNNKALITLYTVNREILIFRKRYLNLNKKISQNLIRRLLRLYKKNFALLSSSKRKHFSSIWLEQNSSDAAPAASEEELKKNKYLDEYFNFSDQDKDQLIHKKDFFNYKLKYFNKYIKYQNIYLKKTLSFIIDKYLKIYFKFLRKYDLMYSLNKYKFNKQILLPILSNILNKIIKKKIEYNIINLKSITYNTDIFTNALALKLKRKKNIAAIKNMFKVLSRAYLPDKTSKYFGKNFNIFSDKVSLDNTFLSEKINYDLKNIHKYDDLNLISILNNGASASAALNTNSYIDSHKQTMKLSEQIESFNLCNKSLQSKLILTNTQSYKNLDKLLGNCFNTKQVHNIIYNSIGYKKMRGIRIEIKGRLTKRYRADRSIYSLKWKGGLKNVDSSFKGLSSVLFRGNSNSNVSYSVYNSKRRIGAFAVKGWISGY